MTDIMPTGTTLHSAVIANRYDWVHELLAKGADVNARDEYLCTPLLRAMEAGHGVEKLQILLAAGAHAITNNEHGKTPFHCAAMNGDVNVMELLYKHHAFIDMATKSGPRPINMAIVYNNIDAARWLFEHGVSGKHLYVESPETSEQMKKLVIDWRNRM